MSMSLAGFTSIRQSSAYVVAGLITILVAVRLHVFQLMVPVATASGIVWMENTFASVDHPFHVARASILWDQLATGHLLRWVGQHQGGYPVEFYPLGEAWFEVVVRAFSLGSLSAIGAHTLAIFLIFVMPAVGFAWLAWQDCLSPSVALLAFVLHLSLPGGWYGGGYTELVQWGLVTNVFGAVITFLMLPLLLRYLRTGRGRYGAAAAGCASLAVYANPRSLIGVAVVAGGAWIAVLLRANAGVLRASTVRLATVTAIAAALAAPELFSLIRFGGLYSFVRYSGYQNVADYVAQSAASVSPIVLVLGLIGAFVAAGSAGWRSTVVSIPRGSGRDREASGTLGAALALVLYVIATLVVTFVPRIAALAPQLEPTRLMPLQRLLTIYLAAFAISTLLANVNLRDRDRRRVPLDLVLVAGSLVLFLLMNRTNGPGIPDPASPATPDHGLFPVEMSAQPVQHELEQAVRLADQRAEPDTAVLVIGSALSWHQPLWSPLWTTRPLYFDNWLWAWQKGHAGTPGYSFSAGNHYPDPAATLTRHYLDTHGIGAVVVSGGVKRAARMTPWLNEARDGAYAVFLVEDPQTTITFGSGEGAHGIFGNGALSAASERTARTATVRTYGFPRWTATADGAPASIAQRSDAYQDVVFADRFREIRLSYQVQPLDWLARMIAIIGAIWGGLLTVPRGPVVAVARRWYARGHEETTVAPTT